MRGMAWQAAEGGGGGEAQRGATEGRRAPRGTDRRAAGACVEVHWALAAAWQPQSSTHLRVDRREVHAPVCPRVPHVHHAARLSAGHRPARIKSAKVPQLLTDVLIEHAIGVVALAFVIAGGYLNGQLICDGAQPITAHEAIIRHLITKA